jgi:glycosyltransferase involved in cell wall biosynthesis
LISIICPIYNCEKYLIRCIDSVLKQTYKDFEFILVNDGSTDASGLICLRYANEDRRISYISLEMNKGVASARNAGLKNAHREFIAWIDSDDYVEVDWLETMYNNLVNNNADISIIDTCNVYENIPRYSIQNTVITANISNFKALEYLINDKISNGLMDKLYKASLFANLVFPDNRYCEDAAVMHILLSRAGKIVASNQKKYNYFYRRNSLAHSYNIKFEYDRFLAYKDRFDFLLQDNYKDLLPKEANIVFLSAIKVIEMGGGGGNNAAIETDMIEKAFDFVKRFYGDYSQMLYYSLIKRYKNITGNRLTKLYDFITNGFTSRLYSCLRLYCPSFIINFVRKTKCLFRYFVLKR